MVVANPPRSVGAPHLCLDLDLSDPSRATALLWPKLLGVNQLWHVTPIGKAFPKFTRAQVAVPRDFEKVLLSVSIANHSYCLRTMNGGDVVTMNVADVNEAALDDVTWIKQVIANRDMDDEEFVLRPCGLQNLCPANEGNGVVLVWVPHIQNSDSDLPQAVKPRIETGNRATELMKKGMRYVWRMETPNVHQLAGMRHTVVRRVALGDPSMAGGGPSSSGTFMPPTTAAPAAAARSEYVPSHAYGSGAAPVASHAYGAAPAASHAYGATASRAPSHAYGAAPVPSHGYGPASHAYGAGGGVSPYAGGVMAVPETPADYAAPSHAYGAR